MRKYKVVFTMDGRSDIFHINTIIETDHDLNTTTSKIIEAVHGAEFFSVNIDPEYYQSQNPSRVAIRTDKIIDIVVKEA
jgi:hypothetical protein